MSNPVLSTTARDIINSAFYAAGILPANQTLEPFELDRGLETLNFIIKHWQAQDIHLWSKTEGIAPLVVSQQSYSMGPDGDEVAEADSFFATNLEADQLAADTLLTLYDLTGINGGTDIFTYEITGSTQDWAATNATILSDGTSLTITNTGAASGYAEYIVDTVVGEEYYFTGALVGGLSLTTTFTITGSANTVTQTVAVGEDVLIRFTADSDTAVIKVEVDEAVIGLTSIVNSINYAIKSSGSRIGIQMDDATRFWTNVISVDSANTQVVIYDSLPSVAADENIVYGYNKKIDRPLRILQLRYADRSDRSEIPTQQWSRSGYFDQPDKSTKGSVNQWYYDPQLSEGSLYVWPVASSVNNVVRFTYTRPLDISVDTIDVPDIPSEWVNALKWNLAKDLALEYGVRSRLEMIIGRAAEALDLSLGYDVEQSVLTIQPDYTGM